MPDGLTPPTHHPPAPPTAPTSRARRRTWVSALVRSLVMLAVFAAAGVAGGYAWRHLWTPPAGEARQGTWVPTPIEEGLQNDFSGVGWYVVVALVLGLVLGAVTALVLDRAELAGVLVVVLGSALAAYLVLTVGKSLSPPDPDQVAATSQDGDAIPGDLEFDGWTPLLSAPLGALTTLSAAYLLTTRRRRAEDPSVARQWDVSEGTRR